jgi:hypothetical protein
VKSNPRPGWKIVSLETLPIAIHCAIPLDECVQSLAHHRYPDNIFLCSDVFQVIHDSSSHLGQELSLLETEIGAGPVVDNVDTTNIDALLVRQGDTTVEPQIWRSPHTIKLARLLIEP